MTPPRRSGGGELLFVSISDGVWGAETSLLTIARSLVAAGRQPRLLCRSADFARAWPGPATVATGRAQWTALLRAARRPDVAAVVCCSIDAMPFVAALRALPRRPRLVFDLHYVLPTPGGRRKIALAALLFDGVVAVSRFAVDQELFARPDRLVLHRPVEAPASDDDPEGAASSGGDDAAPVVGVVGRLDPDKRLDLLVEAVALLPAARLVVRGGPGQAPDHVSAITALAETRLGDRVRFEGAVPSAAVMRGLDCLVVANDAETMGRTVAEAQLQRVPVVVPDRGGASELVEDGVTGHTFAAGDARSLAAAIERALAGRHDRDALEAARAAAARRHDPPRVAEHYEAFALTGRRP